MHFRVRSAGHISGGHSGVNRQGGASGMPNKNKINVNIGNGINVNIEI